MSKEETTALIWNKLPNDLPQGYQKSHFHSGTGNANYVAKGKWEYSVSGEVITTDLLPMRYLELTPGYWVENHSQEVTTRKLLLNADYYENSGVLNVHDVQVTSENTSTQTLSQTAVVAMKFKLNWIQGTTTGYDLRVEGSVTNIGIIALENIVFEVTTYDYEGKLLRTDKMTLTPSKIEVGQTVGFSLDIPGANLKKGPSGSFGSYTYRFLTTSGQVITLQK
jgi:hypothetical protein